MTEELYNKINKFCNETDWSKYPTYEHALEEFIKGIVAEETSKLKEENQKWKDEWQEQVQKANDEGYARTLQTIQLTKAKELLNEFMRISKASDEDFEHDYSELIAEAEQFIKDSEGEK